MLKSLWRLVFGRCCTQVRDPGALPPPSHLPPDNVAIVKFIFVVVRVLVFVANVRNNSQQGRSGALLRCCTCHRQQRHGGGGSREGAHEGIFIAASAIVPWIGGGGRGVVYCRPCRRGEDAHVVTVIVGVVVNGTTIAIASAIIVVVILTVAVTIAITTTTAAQPLLPLLLLVDCCLLEVLECLGIDVAEGLAESLPEWHK